MGSSLLLLDLVYWGLFLPFRDTQLEVVPIQKRVLILFQSFDHRLLIGELNKGVTFRRSIPVPDDSDLPDVPTVLDVFLQGLFLSLEVQVLDVEDLAQLLIILPLLLFLLDPLFHLGCCHQVDGGIFQIQRVVLELVVREFIKSILSELFILKLHNSYGFVGAEHQPPHHTIELEQLLQPFRGSVIV